MNVLPTIRHLIATDVDELTEKVHSLQWQIDYTQLEQGPFQAEVLTYQWPDIQLIRVQYSRAIRSLGISPPGKVAIVIALSAPLGWRWHNYELTGDQVVLQTASQGIDHCRWGDFPLAIVLFSLEELLAIAAKMKEMAVVEQLSGTNYVLSPPAPLLRKFRQLLARVFQATEQKTNLEFFCQSYPHLHRAIIVQLFALLSAPSIPVKSFYRHQLVKQAENLVREIGDRPWTVYDLCQQLHVSERTLRYGFQEIFGIGPKAYLQTHRLHGVRRQLKLTSPGETTVMAIAYQWGFWHLGQFSQDYKKMFGELPSVPLNRP